MGTQSKNIRYNIIFKIIAWVLCITGMCAAAWAASGLLRNGWTGGNDSYLESQAYRNVSQSNLSMVHMAYYPNAGSQQALNDLVASLENERVDKITSVAADNGAGNTKDVIDAINKLYDGKIQDEKNRFTQDSINEQAAQKADLEGRNDLLYAVQENGKTVYTNVSQQDPVAYIKNLPSWTQRTSAGSAATGSVVEGTVAQENTAWAASESGSSVAVAPQAYQGDAHVTIYCAIPQNVLEQYQNEYQTRAVENNMYIQWLAGGFAAFILGFIWLLYTAGRMPKDAEVHLLWGDAIPLDVGFVLMGLVLAICVFALSNPATRNGGSMVNNLYNSSFVSLGVASFNLWFVSLAKRIKRREAGMHTVCYLLFGGLHKLYLQSGARVKSVWLAIAWILCALVSGGIFVGGFYIHSDAASIIGFFMMIVFAALTMRFLLKKAAAVGRIIQGLKIIQEGDLDHTIVAAGGPALDTIAQGINHIADGFNSAVGKEVRAERMKTELITNISHDLKTPLTSIIAYIDLLKKEEVPGEKAKQYLDVLEQKAERLKILTEDLFEAAKAASGDIIVNMSKIELVQFVQQVLGEMSDKIEKSGLVFINDIPGDKMYVCADGRLLWRVMGNVLDNVFKYALEGSRVYIDLKKTLKNINITVKNISKDPLNISAEELMERFRRGDASRHTEGSGLGLSIAKDLMQIMGCGFGIEIDGDLFKVTMKLKEA